MPASRFVGFLLACFNERITGPRGDNIVVPPSLLHQAVAFFTVLNGSFESCSHGFGKIERIVGTIILLSTLYTTNIDES